MDAPNTRATQAVSELSSGEMGCSGVEREAFWAAEEKASLAMAFDAGDVSSCNLLALPLS